MQRPAGARSLELAVEGFGDLERVRVHLEHREQPRPPPVERLDAIEVHLRDRPAGEFARAHALVDSVDRDLVEREVGHAVRDALVRGATAVRTGVAVRIGAAAERQQSAGRRAGAEERASIHFGHWVTSCCRRSSVGPPRPPRYSGIRHEKGKSANGFRSFRSGMTGSRPQSPAHRPGRGQPVPRTTARMRIPSTINCRITERYCRIHLTNAKLGPTLTLAAVAEGDGTWPGSHSARVALARARSTAARHFSNGEPR